MSCKDCGKKANRHAQATPMFRGDMDAGKVGVANTVEQASLAGKGFKAEAPDMEAMPAPPTDPLAALMAAQKMTYQELTQRRLMQQRMIKRQAEAILSEMTDDMRRIHVDELIGVANAERLSLPGMTPPQAIVALQETLERPDFAFIEEVYPGLTQAVSKRFKGIMAERLPGPENQ